MKFELNGIEAQNLIAFLDIALKHPSMGGVAIGIPVMVMVERIKKAAEAESAANAELKPDLHAVQ